MIISKRIKYLGVNLSKEAKDLYSETYKTLVKETEDNTDKKIHYVLRLKESILLKWLHYPKISTDLMQPLIHYQCHFSHRTRAKILLI